MEQGWSRGREVEIYKKQGDGPCGSHLGLPSRAGPVMLPPPPEAGDRAHLPVLGTAISRGSLELSPARNPRGLKLLETTPVWVHVSCWDWSLQSLKAWAEASSRKGLRGG